MSKITWQFDYRYTVRAEDTITGFPENLTSYSGFLTDLYDSDTYGGTPGILTKFNFSNITDARSLFQRCKFKIIPLIDTSNVTNMDKMFYNCQKLVTIPLIDTSKVTNMAYMFYQCSNLVSIPELDTSNVTNMDNMFSYCQTLLYIPELDTSNVTNMRYMFYNCQKITSLPQLNTSNVTNMEYIFANCGELRIIPQFDTSKVTNFNYTLNACNNLEFIPELDMSSCITFYDLFGYNNATYMKYVGGFKNLGKVSDMKLSSTSSTFKRCPNLTKESVLNIINGLYDRASAGYSTLTMSLHANSLALLTDEEKAIATNKGWILS